MSLTDIATLLGKPYFQAPNCLIYNMDSLEAMKLLPKELVAVLPVGLITSAKSTKNPWC